MKRASILLVGIVLFAIAAGMVATASSAQAQGIYIGPGGVSFGSGVGSYYLPYFNRGGFYGPRGYLGRRYDPTGLFWAPGVYWTPRTYWYGDLGWTRFENVISERRASNIPDFSPSQFDDRWNLPPVPQFEELTRMNWTHLRRVLAFGASQLDNELERVATGAKWISYLQVARLEAISMNQKDLPPTHEETVELEALLKKFDQTADDKQYDAISGLWGFEAVRRTISAFVENPAARYRKQLVMNSKDLDRELERFATGATWQQYFALPTDVFVDPDDAATQKSPPDPEALRIALAKFDDVSKNPAYRMIASLPAFSATHASLARYLGRDPADTSNSMAGSYPGSDTSAGGSGEKVTPQADPLQPMPNGGNTPAENPMSDTPVSPAEKEELVPPGGDTPKPTPVPAVREKE